MKAHRALYAVATQCRVLGVSKSGYYAWLKRPISKRAAADLVLKERIVAIHTRSFGTYGAPRIHAQLAFEGTRVGRKRVARLLREMGLFGVSRRKGVCTTRKGQEEKAAPDLVNRDFRVFAPDQL